MKNKRYRELAAILVMMTMTAGSITTVAAETDAFCAMSLIVAMEIKSFLININLSHYNREKHKSKSGFSKIKVKNLVKIY